MADIEEQPLPRTFEEFNEQRKAAFIRVKDYKQAGNRLVGFLCSYTPLEIIDAAGAASVALCGTSDEVIPEAEKVLPANLCPLIKSTYGFAYSQKCPFTYFSDMIIGETTCDGKKKMYELLNELKRTHILHLPQGRDRAYEREGWYEGQLTFKRVVLIPATGKHEYRDTRFVARCKALSGVDCYNRVVDYLRQHVDNRSQFPSAKGKNFQFSYLGMWK